LEYGDDELLFPFLNSPFSHTPSDFPLPFHTSDHLPCRLPSSTYDCKSIISAARNHTSPPSIVLIYLYQERCIDHINSRSTSPLTTYQDGARHLRLALQRVHMVEVRQCKHVEQSLPSEKNKVHRLSTRHDLLCCVRISRNRCSLQIC